MHEYTHSKTHSFQKKFKIVTFDIETILIKDDRAPPSQGLRPQLELWLLVFKEYFSHPAEPMHRILVEKEGYALQLCWGCSQHVQAHTAGGTSMSFPCSLPRHWEQHKVSGPGDLEGVLPPHGSQIPLTPAG